MTLTIWKRIVQTKYGVALGLCILLEGMVLAVVSPLLPIVVSNRIGLDKMGVTAFFVINTLVGIVITLSTGYLSDGLVARYKLVFVSGIVAIIGNLGIASATLPLHIYLAGIAAAVQTILFPQLFAIAQAGIVADWDHDAKVMGITALRTLFSFGFILGTALASWLARAIDIQAVFFLMAIGLIFLTGFAAIVLYQLEKDIAQRKSQPEPSSKEAGRTTTFVMPVVALILPLVALAALQGADATRRVYLPLVMFQTFHDAGIAPLMFGIAAASELVTMNVLGYLASKIGEKRTIVIGAAVGAAYFVILGVSQWLPLLYFANILYAVFVAALLGVAMAYIQGLLSHRVGMGGSLYIAVLNLGSLVGVIGPLLVTGYAPAVFFVPAFLCIVGAVILMVGDRTAKIRSVHLTELNKSVA